MVKYLLMRLLSFLLTILFLFVDWYDLQAQGDMSLLDRRISIQIDSAKVEQILEKVVDDNDLYFSYNPEILPVTIHSFDLADAKLGDFLRSILPEQNYHLEVVDHQIIITLSENHQIKISGRVVEGRRDDPIPYATLTIADATLGTMTNIDGGFDLIIPARLRDHQISVRCLGFETFDLSVDELVKESTIRLKPISIRLKEIEVKPVDVAQVLRTFRSRISENYEPSSQLMVTFYRETIRRDNQYVGVWEAIMEILKSAYSSGGTDRVRFLKGRKSDFNKTFKDLILKMQGGPWYITKLDIVRNLETFLDPEFEHLYRYRFEQPLMVNGRVTWVIGFSRKEDVDYPCYYGKILIDAESYALVSADFSLDKKSLKLNGETFIKKEPRGFVTRPEGAEYKVNYRLVNDRWQFYSAKTDVLFNIKQNRKNFKTEFRSVSDILVTQQYPYPRSAHFGSEGLFRADDVFSDIIGSYDRTFWGNYNVIKPDDDLSKAIKASEVAGDYAND